MEKKLEYFGKPITTTTAAIGSNENDEKVCSAEIKSCDSSNNEENMSTNNAEETTEKQSMKNLPNTFVYEPTSGMYYDQDTGYYYNVEYGLYYDGNNGCYYSFNEATNKYELYSGTQDNNEKDPESKSEDDVKQEKELEEVSDLENNEKEDGEISSECSSDTKNVEGNNTTSFINEIREAAEKQQVLNGFLYEPKSGLYYHQKSGYYYNAECGLYYDGNTGFWYKLNQFTEEFELYYKGENEEKCEKIKNNPRKRKLSRKKDKNLRKIDENPENFFEDSDYENHEIYENKIEGNDLGNKKIVADYDSSNNGNDENEKNNSDAENEFEDISDYYPPSLRLIVIETNLSKIYVGTLFIITYKGGTLGREGHDHSGIIPDDNISKYHLKFLYNDKDKIYQCIDLGSRNGTIINNKRISSSKQESEPINIEHGTVIKISQTKLLCHIHKGNRTCYDCEPGCVMNKVQTNKNNNIIHQTPNDHKQQLKLLKKRYGLNLHDQTNSTNSNSRQQYTDRAEERRKNIGSSSDYEKIHMASVDTEIPKENKGYQMLEKMGWKKGETLYENEPIKPTTNIGTAGLGYQGLDIENMSASTSFNKNSKRVSNWVKVQQRYRNLTDKKSSDSD